MLSNGWKPEDFIYLDINGRNKSRFAGSKIEVFYNTEGDKEGMTCHGWHNTLSWLNKTIYKEQYDKEHVS